MNCYELLYKKIQETKVPFTTPTYLGGVNGYTDIYAEDHQLIVQHSVNKCQKYEHKKQFMLRPR
jgi:hypothetical protein